MGTGDVLVGGGFGLRGWTSEQMRLAPGETLGAAPLNSVANGHGHEGNGAENSLLIAAQKSPLYLTHVPSIGPDGTVRWNTLREEQPTAEDWRNWRLTRRPQDEPASDPENGHTEDAEASADAVAEESPPPARHAALVAAASAMQAEINSLVAVKPEAPIPAAAATLTEDAVINPEPAQLQRLIREGYVGTLNGKGDMAYRPPTAEETDRRLADTERLGSIPGLLDERIAQVAQARLAAKAQKILERWQREDQDRENARRQEESYPWWPTDDEVWIQRYFPADGARPDSPDYELPDLLERPVSTGTDTIAGAINVSHPAPKSPSEAGPIEAAPIDEDRVIDLMDRIIVSPPKGELDDLLAETIEVTLDDGGRRSVNRYWRFPIKQPNGSDDVIVLVGRPEGKLLPSVDFSNDPLEPSSSSLLSALGFDSRILNEAVRRRVLEKPVK